MSLFTTTQWFMLIHLAMSTLFVHAVISGFLTFVRNSEGPVVRKVRNSGMVAMAVLSWLAVVSGTLLIYPGYRATPSDGANLEYYPQSWLTHTAGKAWWHTFGMEWKEHIGWLAPFIATGVAVVVLLNSEAVRTNRRLRALLGGLFAVAVASSVIAAVLGASLNKVAPNLFLNI